MRTLKLSILFLMIFLGTTTFAQKVKVKSSNGTTQNYSKGGGVNEETNIKGAFIGGGVGYGFFWPKVLNDYLVNIKYASYTTYNAEIYMNYNARLVLGTMISKNIGVRGGIEAAIGPKYMTGADEFYSVNRVTPNAGIDLFIPIGDGANSFFLGGSASMSLLGFETFNATALGGQARGGIRWSGMDRFFFDVFGALDIIKGNTGNILLPELSYTGIQMGVTGYILLSK